MRNGKIDGFLTRSISATIAQLRFSANSPKNTRAYAIGALAVTINMAPAINGALNKRPTAQIIGSERGYFFLRYVDKYDPNGTPQIPEVIVITPNLNETLQI